MRRDWSTVGLWGLFLLALAALLLGWERSWLQLLLLGGSAAVVLLGAVVLARTGRRPRAVRPAETSYATVVVAVGVTAALLGLAFGTWLLLPGVGLALVGGAAMAREALR